MNLHQHPDLLDRLAASYALGTLRGGARRRFETLARTLPPVQAAALTWQARLAGLTELQPGTAPGAEVWQRIDNLVRADQQARAMRTARTAPAPRRGGWWQSLPLWRGAAAAGALATLLAVVSGVALRDQLGAEVARLQAKLDAGPGEQYVAVLTDAQSAASVLVTFDPQRRQLVLQRVSGYREAGDKSLQLWALPPGAAPRSLGVLGSDRVLRLTANEGDVREVPALAISLEPQGGVPSAGGPTGPVLFQGPLLHQTL